jgi:hypothetical protein
MKNLLSGLILITNISFGQEPPASSGYLLTNANGSISIGTAVNTAPITVANFSTSFTAPQAGTILHLVSDAVTNGRFSFDSYQNTNTNGSIFQGRRARGTAASPTAAMADDILVAVGGDGYGDNAFHGISMGGFTLRSLGTMTNSSAPTYLTFSTVPTGTTTQTERLRILSTGALKFLAYGIGTFTGTPAYTLQVDASGNIIEGTLSESGTVTSIGLTSSDITVGGTASPITSNGTFTLTLPTINSNVGSFTNASITVDGKGRVTSASSGSSSGQTFSQVAALMVIRY